MFVEDWFCVLVLLASLVWLCFESIAVVCYLIVLLFSDTILLTIGWYACGACLLCWVWFVILGDFGFGDLLSCFVFVYLFVCGLIVFLVVSGFIWWFTLGFWFAVCLCFCILDLVFVVLLWFGGLIVGVCLSCVVGVLYMFWLFGWLVVGVVRVVCLIVVAGICFVCLVWGGFVGCYLLFIGVFD